jgi:hypothetical protein
MHLFLIQIHRYKHKGGQPPRPHPHHHHLHVRLPTRRGSGGFLPPSSVYKVVGLHGDFLYLSCGPQQLTCHVYLWDPTAYVSHVPVGPFSISIRPVGPDGLHVTCTCGTMRPMEPDGSRVMCTYGTFLYLHPTYGTRWLACHLYLFCCRGLIN